MQLYKVSIKLKSAFVTPLKGDTIWGHIVWGIANHEDEQAVEKFLAEEKSAGLLPHQCVLIKRQWFCLMKARFLSQQYHCSLLEN